MDIVPTVFALGCVLVSAFCVFACYRHVDEAAGIARDLALERATLTALQGQLDALHAQHKKLNGRFYAALQQFEQDELAGTVEQLPSSESNIHELPVCENYAIAQRDGPRSQAAQCECLYCLGKRAERELLRKQHVPKTARAQGDLAKLNAGQTT